jgi:regulator of cell morphogenesis and NO signaling
MAQEIPDADSLALEAATPIAQPQDTDWTTVPLRELITHLVQDHHAYFRKALPELQQLLETVVAKHGCDDGVLRPLSRVFESLQMDLLIHMEKEELLLFPAIERYEQAAMSGKPLAGSPFSTFGGPVNIIEHEHETAGAAVRLIRDFTRNYAEPATTCELYRALIEGLREFERRLQDHVEVENNVLFARAAALNARHQQGPKYGGQGY